MQIHQLKSNKTSREKKRIGRGGKRGTFSGRGTKGQKARAGRKIRPDIRDMIIRIPKLKGLNNKTLQPKTVAVNLSILDKKVKDAVITKETLIKNKIITNSIKRVKILGNGEISRAITVKGLEVSKTAKDAIEKKGGSVE